MKNKISILVLIAMLTACGCSAKPESSVSSVPGTEEAAASGEELTQPTAEQTAPGTIDTAEPDNPTDSTGNSPAATAEAPAESGFVLTGPGGDIVKPEEMTRVTASDEQDYIANGINSGNWEQVEVSGFTYLAEPGGQYRRVRTGEEICGLTLMDCGCVFSAEKEVQPGANSAQSWFSSAWAEFDGSAELTGTLAPVFETSDIAQEGDFIFSPDESPELPVMDYTFTGDDGVTAPPAGTYPVIIVSGADVTENTHVRATLAGITMSASVNGNSIVRANVSAFTAE